MKRLPLISSLLLFALLCASAAYWGMQLFKPPVRAVAMPPPVKADIDLNAAAGLFGGRSVSVAVASNFQLKGVVVASKPRESLAILAADGQPAQPIGIDKEAAPGVTVKEVHRQYVLLSEGGVVKRVDLPENVRDQAGDQARGYAPAGISRQFQTGPAANTTVVQTQQQMQQSQQPMQQQMQQPMPQSQQPMSQPMPLQQSHGILTPPDVPDTPPPPIPSQNVTQ